MIKTKKFLSSLVLITMVFQILIVSMPFASAASAGQVVINEISWAGSLDNSNDEWIELYNTTNQSIDLTGWYIEDDYGSATYTITSGTISAYGYFLIEDIEEATNITADAVIGISLANTGDTLVLKDSTDAIIDGVNTGGGAWYAGDGTTKATMERIDPSISADELTNWASAISNNGAIGSSGSSILGTPGSVNSNFAGASTNVSFNLVEAMAINGETITVTVDLTDGTDIYAYGFDIIYDPTVLTYISATEGGFLNSDGQNTGFFASLEDGNEGTLVVGNSRLINPASGLDGSGQLLTISFNVIGADGTNTDLSFGAESFISDSIANLPANLTTNNILVENGNIDPISNLQVSEGTERYSLELTWDAPASGADSYIIEREMANGTFLNLGEVSTLTFIDDDTVVNGGSLVPNISYDYRITAVKSGLQSVAISETGTETRGLSGDNNRSDRVDGRDIEKLARSFGSNYGETDYALLNDTTFDGVIDGSDLIDIGANFALTY